MREILFRGKRVDNGEWVYSSFIMHDKEHKVLLAEVELFDGEKWRAVDPETVGQFIGLTDKNGKKIFEGDIIKDNGLRIYMIGYNEELMKYAFLYYHKELKNLYCGGFVSKTDGKSIEVIGNKWDNPELVEEQE